MKKLLFLLITYYFTTTGCQINKSLAIQEYQEKYFLCEPSISAPCDSLFMCYEKFFTDYPKGRDTLNYTYKKVIWQCAEYNLKLGNPKARELMIKYYTNQFYFRKSQETMSPWSYKQMIENFKGLYGQDVFMLGLLYASEGAIGINMFQEKVDRGLLVVEELIFPSIKSVGGYSSLDEYLLVDNFKNRTYSYEFDNTGSSKREYYFLELQKAYKEGIIILKK